ncbi:MAG: plasmid pRiA4b ORF-3 family protein, partial [Bacteroidota bacterium]
MTSPLKLKIAVQNLPHKCERTFLVPEDLNMLQLHFIIQDSFEWHNEHLFEFSDAKSRPGIRVGIPNEFDDEFDFLERTPKQKVDEVKLKEVFLIKNQGKPFLYWYDFGDDWWHRISFLKTSLKDMRSFEGIPLCIKAVGKCPPENIGGPWGYSEFLEAIE